MFVQQFQGHANEVVKVHALVGAQPLFVAGHDFGDDAFVVVFGQRQRLGGVEAHVLPQADGPLPLACGGNVGRAARVFQDACHITAVHDAELGFEAHHAAVLAQHAHAQGVKGANQHIVGGFANQTFGTLAHFGGGFVGKGDGGNPLGLKPCLNKAANLVRDDTCLSRARPRQHQTRTVQEIDGFLLREIQTSRHSGDS